MSGYHLSSAVSSTGPAHLYHLAESLEDLLCLVRLSVDGETESEVDPVASLVRSELEEGEPVCELEGVVAQVERQRCVVPEDLEGVLWRGDPSGRASAVELEGGGRTTDTYRVTLERRSKALVRLEVVLLGPVKPVGLRQEAIWSASWVVSQSSSTSCR